MKRAQLPDGTVLEFPADTPDSVMDATVRKHLGAPTPKAAPRDNNAMRGLAGGILKPFDNAAMALRQIPGVGAASDFVADITGLPRDQAQYQANQAARQNNTRTGYQMAGNIAGTLPTISIPGGPFVQGAVSGGLLSDRNTPTGVALDSAIGGVTGKVAQSGLNAIGNAMNPVVSAASRKLYEAGIPQTIGQIAQGGKSWGSKMLAAGEEALTSVPLIGDVINSARNEGVEAFNTAIANRALKSVGASVPKGVEPGIGMVDYVAKKLSDKYQSLVPKLVGAFDGQFATDLGAAKKLTTTLPAARQKQFGQIVQDVFGNRAQGRTIAGQALKDAESRLTKLAKDYSRSTDTDQRILGDALFSVRDALRGSVMRSNPAHGAELQAINKGWAQLKPFEAAANAPGNATGVVTPAQMLAASRKTGFRDDLSRAAKEILPSRTPDSGTARRGLTAMLAAGAGGAAATPMLGPGALIPAAGSMLYTKPVSRALNAFVFSQRPKVLKQGAAVANRLARVAPSGTAAATSQRRPK